MFFLVFRRMQTLSPRLPRLLPGGLNSIERCARYVGLILVYRHGRLDPLKFMQPGMGERERAWERNSAQQAPKIQGDARVRPEGQARSYKRRLAGGVRSWQ